MVVTNDSAPFSILRWPRRRPRARATGRRTPAARKVLGWPKICKLAHAFLWEYSHKRLKLAQLLGQLGVFLTCGSIASIGVAPPAKAWRGTLWSVSTSATKSYCGSPRACSQNSGVHGCAASRMAATPPQAGGQDRYASNTVWKSAPD